MPLAIHCSVNGNRSAHAVNATLRLSDFLRETLHLTGLNIGCGEGVCGACTVLVDGVATRSCLVLAAQCDGAEIETVEGLREPDGSLSRSQAAFHRHNAFQCGFCTSGFLMVVEEMLREQKSAPLSDEAVADRLSSILCRCTGYLPVRRAVTEILGAST